MRQSMMQAIRKAMRDYPELPWRKILIRKAINEILTSILEAPRVPIYIVWIILDVVASLLILTAALLEQVIRGCQWLIENDTNPSRFHRWFAMKYYDHFFPDLPDDKEN